MSSEELYYRLNPWWSGEFRLKGIVLREQIFHQLTEVFPTKDIIFLTGLRRIGKTTLMRVLIQYLIKKKKIHPSHIFYVSLDEYSLKGKTLHGIIDEYRAVQRLKSTEQITVFLDEITAMPDYQVQLKNIYDRGGVKVYASSSSASLLRSGASYVTGRQRVIKVAPLDFKEYLSFKGIELSPADSHLTKVYFEDFMKSGGIPEYVLSGDITYLHQLVDDIICKDIAAYYGIKHLGILKDFFMLLMERAGKSVSVNKIAKILDISPDTARRYLSLFEETYLIHLVPRYGKLNEQLRSPKKIYAADLGIRVLFTGYRDIGSLFENYVYLKIADSKPRFLLEDGIEIDFITEGKKLIEVKYFSEMREKQVSLFKSFPASERVLVQSIRDLEKVDPEQHPIDYSIAEKQAVYSAYDPVVNLGRSPGLETDL